MNADNWKLNRVDNSEYKPDDTGIYVLINWDIQTDTVRLDFMSRKNEPIQSFAGSSDNVRKHAMRYIHKISRVNWPNSGFDISLEHAAYIGSELQKADIFRIDYVQDSGRSDKVSLACCGCPITLEELPGNYNHNFIGRCKKCGIAFGIEKFSDVDVESDNIKCSGNCDECQ